MPSRIHHSLLLAVVTAAAALLLQQDAVHHLDMHFLVRDLASPEGRTHYGHFGFQWIAHGVWALVEGTDMTVYQGLRTLCGLCLGLAAFCAHRACVAVGLGASRALAAALGACAVPGVLFFATTTEVHGVFLPLAYAAWWALARTCRPGPGEHDSAGSTPTPGSLPGPQQNIRQGPLQAPTHGALPVIVVGALTASAAAVHTTGHLMVFCVAAVLWLHRSPTTWPPTTRAPAPWVSRLRPIVGFLAVHGAVFLLLRLIDRWTLGQTNDAQVAEHLRATLARYPGLGTLPKIAWEEYLLAFAPFSVLFVCALLNRRCTPLRPYALMMALAATCYVGASHVLLVDLREHGAYALPLALPAAALTIIALPKILGWASVSAALAISVTFVTDQDPERIPDPALGADIAAAVKAHPNDSYFLWGWNELDSVLVYSDPVWHSSPTEPRFFAFIQPRHTTAEIVALVDRLVNEAAARGGSVFFSDNALAFFDLDGPLRRAKAQLVNHYQLERRRSGSFAGTALRLK